MIPTGISLGRCEAISPSSQTGYRSVREGRAVSCLVYEGLEQAGPRWARIKILSC